MPIIELNFFALTFIRYFILLLLFCFKPVKFLFVMLFETSI